MKSTVSLFALTLLIPAASAQDTPSLSPEHAVLKRNLGTRTGIMKLWVSPDADPIEMPVTEKVSSILGGFWAEAEFESGPYKGKGVTGYDPIKKKFVGTWSSNVSPHLIMMEGTLNDSKDELTMHFTEVNPADGTSTAMKSVTTFTPGKPETFAMYRKADGKWQKQFVVTYKE